MFTEVRNVRNYFILLGKSRPNLMKTLGTPNIYVLQFILAVSMSLLSISLTTLPSKYLPLNKTLIYGFSRI